MNGPREHHVIIVGGGFGGLYAAKALRGAPARVTLIDRRNFHLFQPLLYQVATGEVTDGDIAYPLREIFKRYRNIHVIAAEVVDIDPDGRRVILNEREMIYDTLIVSAGSSHHYFGHDEWSGKAPGLKTLEDALEIRRRIFLAFEVAEKESEAERQRAWMTFVVVGGGPTGVELAGSLGDLVHRTLKRNFRNIDPADSKILLVEGLSRILPSYPPDLSSKAATALSRLGVGVRTDTVVTDVDEGIVVLRTGDRSEQIAAGTVLWGAGVKASSLGKTISQKTRAATDRSGRVRVGPDLSVPEYPNLFIIGDLAHFSPPGGQPLPGTAAVAIQQGAYVGRLMKRRLKGKGAGPFHYVHKGSMSAIGRASAVADFGRIRFNGFIAWMIWALVHIRYLIGFDNKLIVLFQWGWSYITRRRSARLIVGETKR